MTPHNRDELLARIAGRRVVASISGGKDSAAMSLYLTELGIEHDRVFMDTGWEHPAVYAYLRGPLTRAIGRIVEVRSAHTMESLCLHKGVFPTHSRRFCTDELKKKPLREYVARVMSDWRSCSQCGDGDWRENLPDDECDCGGDYSAVDVLNTVGIRAEESEARARNPEWEESDWLDCEVWRPILRWTEQDVIDIHQRHGLAPCPLYLRGAGARRVGCWPCIHSTKDEIRMLAETDPGRVDYLRDLERRVSARAVEKGLAIPHQTWFRAEQLSQGFPIDEAVEWARTARGGKQFELFAGGGRSGCMRWGLCDTGTQATACAAVKPEVA